MPREIPVQLRSVSRGNNNNKNWNAKKMYGTKMKNEKEKRKKEQRTKGKRSGIFQLREISSFPRVESASLRRHPWKTGILLAGISVASAERFAIRITKDSARNERKREGFRNEQLSDRIGCFNNCAPL